MRYIVVVDYLDAEGKPESMEIISPDAYESHIDALDELKEAVMEEMDAADFILMHWQDRMTLRVKMPDLEEPYRERVYRIKTVQSR